MPLSNNCQFHDMICSQVDLNNNSYLFTRTGLSRTDRVPSAKFEEVPTTSEDHHSPETWTTQNARNTNLLPRMIRQIWLSERCDLSCEYRFPNTNISMKHIAIK